MKKSIEWTVKYIQLIAFCLVLSTLFLILHQLVNGIISGKYFWFYCTMALVSFVMAVSCLLYHDKVYFSIDDGFILLFCILGLMVTALNSEMYTTKWILLLLLIVLYFYFRIYIMQDKRNLFFLVLFLLITGLVESVWGLCQLYGFANENHPLFRITGSFFNPGPYSGYLAMLFPLSLYYWINNKRLSKNENNQSLYTRISRLTFYISVINCIVILLVLPAAMSRASWLALITGSMIVGFDYLHHRFSIIQFYKKHAKKVWLVFVLGIFLSGVALYSVYHLKKDSADGRIFIWKVTLKAIPNHPWGVGLNRFAGTYSETQSLYFASGQASKQEEYVAGSPEYGFNEYLQICLEWGVFPLILFLFIIARSLYIGFKRKKIAFVAAIISLLFFAGTSYPFSILPITIVMVFLLATIHSTEGVIKTKKGVSPIYPVLIGCLVTTLCIYNRYPVYYAYQKWKIAKNDYSMAFFEDAAYQYRQLYPYLNDQIYFLFEYAQTLSKLEQYAESNEVLLRSIQISSDPMLYNILGKNYQAMNEYDLAEKSFRKSSLIVPNRIYPYYLLMKLHLETGYNEKVIEYAEIVLTKEPKVHSTATEEMHAEAKKILLNEN